MVCSVMLKVFSLVRGPLSGRLAVVTIVRNSAGALLKASYGEC